MKKSISEKIKVGLICLVLLVISAVVTIMTKELTVALFIAVFLAPMAIGLIFPKKMDEVYKRYIYDGDEDWES